MPKVLRAFPEQPSHSQAVELDGETYRLRLTWRPRLGAWYFALWRISGAGGDEPVVLGRRVSPDFTPTSAVPTPPAPPGEFLVRGPDQYQRSDLGTNLQIIYLSADELDDIDLSRNRYDLDIRVPGS